MIVKLGNKKHKVQKAGLYTLPIALKCQAGKLYAMFHIRVYYLSKPVLHKFMLKLTITTGLIYMYFKALNINPIKTFFVVWNTNLYQNIAIIISTKCINDRKCPFNTENLDHKYPFNLPSSARSYEVNRWHDKSLHIIPVKILSATFIQE